MITDDLYMMVNYYSEMNIESVIVVDVYSSLKLQEITSRDLWFLGISSYD